ncbi:conserved Plasmodium protein, unknown function [Plasmodium relictum]|uniref:ATPase AAA-type core domain-containing protein n=1 Tax=Plasmodium relictum TaxID=85471 RepID=A0A1J1H869_PLARL|nr:conserved Plasmodium protein, unknown function [Plasmodium relictum]CRG99797.1 conserved Plasmodium protein, unknown function [Plasmodium relictum]
MFNLLKNFHDFIKEIEYLKIQNESKSIIKHNSGLNKNDISTNINEEIIKENKKINEINANDIKEIKYNENIDEILQNENKNDNFIFLFSSIGKELFIDSEIMQKNSLLKKELVIKFETNYYIILNKNKYVYSVVIRNNKLSKNNKLIYVYSLCEYCKQNYPNNINFYVQFNLFKKKFRILKISILNLNNEIWCFTFSKNNLKNKLEILNNSKSLCFILFYNLLIKEYRIYVSDIIKKLKKKKKSIFFIVDNEEDKDSYECKKEEENIYENKKSDILIYSECNYDTVFFNKIFSVFNLLREENDPFLKFYNLENYTRIFIYNCENLNRNSFINFLKSFENFHIYLINLNTLFGIYFSETEKNILNVFKKCERILRRGKKNVAIVLDGIDIIAKKNTSEEKEELLDENNEKFDNNNNSRILTTLLLCLDSIDNCTVKKKIVHEKEINQSIKSIKEGKKNEKKKNRRKKNLVSFSDDCDNISDESKSSIVHSSNNTKKKKKLSEQITYDIKKLEKIYKERYIRLVKRKTKNNISVIVLSDLNLNCFDISLIRAGRFFHYIKYS